MAGKLGTHILCHTVWCCGSDLQCRLLWAQTSHHCDGSLPPLPSDAFLDASRVYQSFRVLCVASLFGGLRLREHAFGWLIFTCGGQRNKIESQSLTLGAMHRPVQGGTEMKAQG
jgi:hypothetical protein